MKNINYKSIEVDGIDGRDYPDFSDAYVSYAEYEDGTPLDEDELVKLQDKIDINEHIFSNGLFI